MAKDLISFPDLVTGLGGIDLLGDAVRKSAGGEDAFQGKDTFKAVVLTRIAGDKMTNTELAGLVGSSYVKSNTRQQGRTHAYFVKIVENSPHAYLPDPCPQGSTGLAQTTKNHLIQGMYTIAIDQDESRTITKNSVVFLKLNKTDFSYDTDFGFITSVVGDASSEVAQRYKCASPSAVFSQRSLDSLDPGQIVQNIGDVLSSPLNGNFRISSGFGMRNDPKSGERKMHKGVDYATPVGTPIYAIADGTVKRKVNSNDMTYKTGYGKYIKLYHSKVGNAKSVESRYAHLDDWSVPDGSVVKKGQLIGLAGNTGKSTGPHLHFEIRVDGIPVDPVAYLASGNAVAEGTANDSESPMDDEPVETVGSPA